MPTFDELAEQQEGLFANQAAFDAWLANFIDGGRDAADSFDRNGLPSSDPEHGDLGHYPYEAPDGTIYYRPCLDRLVADAEIAPANAAAARIGLVDIGQYVGRLAGQTGSYLLVPLIEAGYALRLANQASLVLPKTGVAQALLFGEPTPDGISVTIGAANAPLPPPDGPTEPLDLGSGGMVYAPPGEVTPLSITIPPGISALQIDVPEEIDLVLVNPFRVWTPVSFGLDFADPSNPSNPTGGPWAITGDGLVGTVYLNKEDPGDDMVWDVSNHPTVAINSGFKSPALGLEFEQTDDVMTDRVPHRFAITFTGVAPAATGIVATVFDFGTGEFRMTCWSGGFALIVRNAGAIQEVALEFARDYVGVHEYKLEWRDNEGGEGGTAEMFVDGVSVATADTVHKPTIATAAAIYLNNAVGNYSNSIAGIQYHTLTFEYDLAETEYDYEPFDAIGISAADIVRLAVDARAVVEQQPLRTISYNALAGPISTIDVVVGEVILPAGRAYKAVLMTYPDGLAADPVAHPNELVMTRFAVQNARFEDDWLFQTQPSWSECIPEGDPPVIDDIVYTCDAVRIGTYVQFQFGYHVAAAANSAEPFGNLNAIGGFVSYMVPHKWYIYDQEGTLLARVEQPNGDPLNASQELPIWQGPWGLRNAAFTTPGNRWWPAGTIGSGVVWASHDLVDHDREEIERRVPIPETIIPFACHTDFSVNGFDPRLAMGFNSGEGHMNGFANWRIMPYEPSDYQSWVAAAGTGGDPYTGLDSALSRATNGSIWLKYTPFNVQGRSPITGPGGVRDDRQAIAEPVSAYLVEPDGEHIVNGESFRQIAIDYCRGYASDPFQLFENGRNVPLFKGNMQRGIGLANHYYGIGDLGTADNLKFDLSIGRVFEWMEQLNPVRVLTSRGSDPDHPWRGLFGIDEPHAHQFPGWGSLLWKTPEFAFLQMKFFDQIKLYGGSGGTILGTNAAAMLQRITLRDGAWMFLHTAMAWKLSSANSPRLYSRTEVLDWAVADFERFHDQIYVTDPGILNPPAVGSSRADLGPWDLAGLVGLTQFGMCARTAQLEQQAFMRGYWITALGIGERFGFNDAIREASAEAGAVLDWMIAMWRRAITGNLIEISTTLPAPDTYTHVLWTEAQLESLWAPDAGLGTPIGDFTVLPSTYAEVEAVNGVTATWDTDPIAGSLDGQGMSAILGAPFWLKNVLLLAGEDIDAACAIARARIDEKLAEQEALGAAAGSTWFKYHQGTFTPPLPPPE